MSVAYQFGWRKSLTDFIDDMSRIGISEIQRIDIEKNEVQVDW